MPDLWPFAPLTPTGETLTFNTRVTRHRGSVQRRAFRAIPRQVLEFKHVLQPSSAARAAALMDGNQNADFYVPVWFEGVRSPAVVATDTSVAIDTTASSFRAGDFCLLWDDENTSALLTIDTVTAGGLTFTGQVGQTLGAPMVLPVRVAFLSGPPSASDAGRTHTRLDIAFEARGGADLAANPFDTYRSRSVVTSAPLVPASPTWRRWAPLGYSDHGVGPVATDLTQDYSAADLSVTYLNLTRDAAWARRQWLHFVRGGAVAFWHPSFRNDLVLSADISAGSTLDVLSNGATYTRHIRILLDDGTRYYREVTGAVAGAGVHTLTVDTALPAIPAAVVNQISFMDLVRISNDQVRQTHHLEGRSTTTISMEAVPDDP